MAAPGCTFEPSEQELTDVCLYGKITGAGRDVGAIHVADVYSADPETLAKSFAPAPGTGRGDKEPEWYFFSPVRYASKKKNSGRRARIIGCDSNKKWHSEIGAVPVEGSAVGGHKVNLTYMVRSNASGEKKKHERAGWILAEFGIAPEHGGGQLELCKLHRSPHFQETAAGSKKRKAAAADELYSADRCKNLCLRQEMPQDRPRELIAGILTLPSIRLLLLPDLPQTHHMLVKEDEYVKSRAELIEKELSIFTNSEEKVTAVADVT
ncbi:NAC domain-containing protein 53 [Brachypodium distachyon]|uniref:NAC domain-containing protein 53 n=1 Tax=Brachypodium distachyon TaxID=15368 RepID=UPI0005300BF7|nr:NAC domain-containing protein 53 [Brachypodium distachyon]|eukprot:XP_010229407.1 NAC domain-containing protein 53 [Brachypodium distachyon]